MDGGDLDVGANSMSHPVRVWVGALAGCASAIVAADTFGSPDGGGAVSVICGDGHGGFAASVDYPAGPGTDSVTAGDFNGDGVMDLAAANASSNSVSVFYGNAAGGFQPAVGVSTGAYPYAVTAGDFNGDGRLDLATANHNGSVSVLYGLADGGFQRSDVAFADATLAVAGDFNGDRIDDLAIGDAPVASPSGVSVLLGEPDGGVLRRSRFVTGSQSRGAAVADLDRDGKLDLAVANLGDDDVRVLRGDGGGDFTSVGVSAAGSQPESVVAVDVDGDGILDLATANFGGGNFLAGTVSVLLGNGDGSFRAPRAFATGDGPIFIAAGDLNRDGLPDLVTANSADGTVSVLLDVCQ